MCDADVDGSHIRTLILTFFFRQMKDLLEKEHVYIAQPPLYRVKRGKKEQYINTEQEMKDFLISQGTDGLKVVSGKEKKILTEKKLIDLLNLLTKLGKISRGIEKRGIKFGKYLELRQEKTNKLPVYRVQVEGEYKYLYNDDELAEFKDKKGEAKEMEMEDEETGEEKTTQTVTVQEFYEARALEKLSKEITKFGLDIADYEKEKEEGVGPKKESTKEKEGEVFLAGEKKIFSLKGLLEHVLAEGEKGLTIQRYKGLGEMNPEQLWETTMDPERRTLQKVTIEDKIKADNMFTVLMGDSVEARRDFILTNARDVTNLDI
ncbi:MAG: hypothetical protein KAI70_05160 [Candidatus Omnitrophica bacterium]|nr:hypothetical protein [Candidatus Omnitrophota bacterium]